MINFMFLRALYLDCGGEKVVQETINALKSMMSTNDIMVFSKLCEKDKIESITGIREIVCGMRAFNRDAGHCGEGLVDSKYCQLLFICHVSLSQLHQNI